MDLAAIIVDRTLCAFYMPWAPLAPATKRCYAQGGPVLDELRRMFRDRLNLLNDDRQRLDVDRKRVKEGRDNVLDDARTMANQAA